MDLTKEFKGSGGKIKIIAVGSLTYQKAMDVLIKGAAELIDRKYFNFIVLIVGEGEKRKELAELVRELKLEKYVKLLHQKLENGKVMIRQIRGDSMRDIKESFEKKESVS